MEESIPNEGVSPAGAWAVIYCAVTETFLFGKRSAAVNKGGAWNFFGGRIDGGELPRAALTRELAEEAGLKIEPADLIELDCLPGKSGDGLFVRKMNYFLLLRDSEFAPSLNFEHSEFRWFKHDQLPTEFNRPTLLAIENGLLEKAKGMAVKAPK
jgi:8-oxo-dGTP diphosphatase